MGETSAAGREDPFHPRLIELYRQATVAEKLSAIERLNSALIVLKEETLQTAHPDWTPLARKTELRRWWFSARD
jgi:hypothetical protein